MKTNSEILFKFGGEGGSISIERVKTKNKVCYMYHHSEFAIFDDDDITPIDKHDEYQSFEEAFNVLDKKYPWHMLCILTIHSDVADFVEERRKLKPPKTEY